MNSAAKPRVVFRADASLQMGTGHVIRCLTLADALAAKGADCQFICRAHAGHLGDFIRQKGYSVHLLDVVEDLSEQDAPLAHALWLGASMAQDAVQTAAQLAHLQPDWLVVDHYALDARWETQQRAHVGRLMVIDDLADRPHDCDLLLDQNLGRLDSDYASRVPAHCQRLLGPAYALLRPEFAALRDYSLLRRQSSTLRTLLITMGGVDKDNATGRILQALAGAPLPQDCRITVVMGATAPWLNEVSVLAASLPWPVDVRVNVSNMAQLMADADLAIGAAGSTSWERCCLGLPTLMAILANNQREAAAHIEKSGIAKLIFINDQLPEQLNCLLLRIRAESGFLHGISHRGQHVTKGIGIKLVVNKIL